MNLEEKIENLFIEENYKEIIIELKTKKSLSEKNQLFLGIAYYKTEQYELADSLFENLYQNCPTNEITTYFIITKIKLNQLLSALSIYDKLCNEEIKQIIKFISNKDYFSALNLTLFLKSIPLDITTENAKSNSLIDIAKSKDFAKLSLELAKLTKETTLTNA